MQAAAQVLHEQHAAELGYGEQIIQQQQQRLLYLRHASKCKPVDGQCPQGYPACQAMRDVWRHIASCRTQRCPYPHCISSRYVLSHFHRCSDDQCPVCIPVRNTIRGGTAGHQAAMSHLYQYHTAHNAAEAAAAQAAAAAAAAVAAAPKQTGETVPGAPEPQ